MITLNGVLNLKKKHAFSTIFFFGTGVNLLVTSCVEVIDNLLIGTWVIGTWVLKGASLGIQVSLTGSIPATHGGS